MPEPLMDMAINQMRQGAEQAMRKAAEENPEAAEIQQAITESYLETMTEAIREPDSYTIGAAIDNKTKSAYLDVEALMKDGSKLAEQVNQSAKEGKPSKLPGLADAARVFNFHLNAPVMEKEMEMAVDMLEQAREKVEEKIKEEIADEEGQKIVIGMVKELFDVAEETIEGGQINGGAVVTGEVSRTQLTSRPTLSWTALPGATKYDLWINNQSTGQQQLIRQEITGTSWTPTTDLAMGLYRAWIRGKDAAGNFATWSVLQELLVVPGPTPIVR